MIKALNKELIIRPKKWIFECQLTQIDRMLCTKFKKNLFLNLENRIAENDKTILVDSKKMTDNASVIITHKNNVEQFNELALIRRWT